MSGHCERCGETAACCCHADDLAFESAILELEARAKRIAALEAANYLQAARLVEMEDENQQLNEDLTIAYMAGVEKGKDEYRSRVHELEDEREKLEKQEPFGYLHRGHGVVPNFHFKHGSHELMMPVFTRPVPARTLTDEVMREIHSRLPITYTYDQLMLATQAWLKGGE